MRYRQYDIFQDFYGDSWYGIKYYLLLKIFIDLERNMSSFIDNNDLWPATFDPLSKSVHQQCWSNTRELSRESRSTILTDHTHLLLWHRAYDWSPISYKWSFDPYEMPKLWNLSINYGPWPVSFGEYIKVLWLSIYNWYWSCSWFDKHFRKLPNTDCVS